ncbi:MAG: paraquat-inducible protein A [Deltaproteobacteria bacterium]|nr:paraquat-inducible protein A [Deltaproteobacteria bacterium]
MDAFIACHECDVIHLIKSLPGKGAAHCIRCGAVLYKHKPNSRERTLAFAIAALILFILANSFPFLGLKIGAQVRQTTLITGIHELYIQGKQVIAILVLLTTVLVPFTQMMCLFYILLPLKFGRLPKGLPWVFRFLHRIQPWGMMEVFMVGILVSVVKLAGMAKIIPGISLFSFLALIFVLAAMTVSLDDHRIWQKWEEHR